MDRFHAIRVFKGDNMMKIVLFLIILSLSGISAYAQTGKIWIEEETTYFQKDTFFVLTVMCDANVTDVKALRLDFDVNSSVVSFDTTYNPPVDTFAVRIGNMFPSINTIVFFDTYLWPDSQRFTIDLAYLPDSATFNGPGQLAKLVISTVDFGTTDIEIADAIMIDKHGASIPVDVAGAWAQVCQFVGDVNADNSVDVADIVYFVNYVFNDGPVPIPHQAGNVNCDDEVDVADIVVLVNYIFNDGPPPCDGCI